MAIISALLGAAAVSGAAKPPHVFFMLVDDLGWNDVGWHDQFGQIQTPRLSALAADSIKLSQYYVYRFCSPSRSTFMSGRYPWHLGQHTHMNLNPTPGIACGINRAYDFMPKVLKRKGYTTWALGKWHLGFMSNSYTPTYRGFDHYLGYYSGAEEHFTHEKKGATGYSAYDLANNSGAAVRPCLNAVGNASSTYSSYLYGNETLRMLASHDPTVPLYVYLAWNNVHDPNEAPDNYLASHGNITNSGRKHLSGMMSAIDDQLVDIVDALKTKQMWDDTVLIFSTDNGGNLGGSGINYPLRGGKYTFWQGGVRGVGFVGGGRVPVHRRGSTWNGFVHAADWYATIAGLAGADLAGTGPLPADGVDIWASLIGDSASPREEVVLQVISDSQDNLFEPPPAAHCEGSPSEAPLCTPPTTRIAGPATQAPQLQEGAIIRGKWKLIYGYPGWNAKWDGWIEPPTGQAAQDEEGAPRNSSLCAATPCLFDIVADPTEHNDIAAAHPELVANLTARLRELVKGEVTVAASGLCPTQYKSKADPRCKDMAAATGFWQPWLKDSELL